MQRSLSLMWRLWPTSPGNEGLLEPQSTSETARHGTEAQERQSKERWQEESQQEEVVKFFGDALDGFFFHLHHLFLFLFRSSSNRNNSKSRYYNRTDMPLT